MICALCGQPIRWHEGQGWLVVGADDQVIYWTGECAARDVPSRGHRLSE